MEPTDALELDHALQLRRLRWSPLWGVFIQGEVRSGATVVVHIAGEDPFEMALSQNDRVIQALPPNRANHTFSVRILPGRLWRSGNLIDPQRPRLAVKHLPVDRISISDQVSGSLLGSARLQKLECCLRRRRMFCRVEVQHPPPIVAQDHQYKQDPECGRGHGEEIKRNKLSGMVLKESSPGLRRRSAPSDHVL